MRLDIQARIDATNKPYEIYAEILEDTAAIQFAECMEQPSVVQGALMPDVHTGYVAPIGSVLAVKDNIFPSFVGYDIGCGMSAIRTNIHKDDVSTEQWIAIKSQILRDIPIGFSRHKKSQNPPQSVTTLPMTQFAVDILDNTGRYQLGTLGGGNHFLEAGYDNNGYINFVVHSGSRGVGHKIAAHYMREAAIQSVDEQRYLDEFAKKSQKWYESFTCAKPQYRAEQEKKFFAAQKEFVYRRTRARVNNIEDAYPLEINSQTGKDYINDMNMALEFALANRKQMIDKCIYALNRVLNTNCITDRFINRNHNHADLKDGLWIHRKGATHAEKSMLGVIPGNMVDGSFIVSGLGSANSMNSSSHGAGRILSRRKAKDTLDLVDFQTSTKHLVANHSDNNLDESPLAYKSIFEVMELQKDLVTVIDRVIPILNIKG